MLYQELTGKKVGPPILLVVRGNNFILRSDDTIHAADIWDIRYSQTICILRPELRDETYLSYAGDAYVSPPVTWDTIPASDDELLNDDYPWICELG